MDGAASAWVFMHKFAEDPSVKLETIPFKAGKPNEPSETIRTQVTETDEVYFVDTAPEKADLDWLLSPREQAEDQEGSQPRIQSLTIWDHHIGTKKRLKKYKPPQFENFDPPDFSTVIDTRKSSAAKLVWQQLNGYSTPPPIVDFVSKMEPTQSNGKPRLSTTSEFAAAAYVDSMKLNTPAEISETFSRLSKMSIPDMVAKGTTNVQDQLKRVERMRKKIETAMIEVLPDKRVKVPMVNTDIEYIGRVVDVALLEIGNEKGMGLAAAYTTENINGRNLIKVSFRSDGRHPNARDVVEHLKTQFEGSWGGGHDDAAVLYFENWRHFYTNIEPKSIESFKASFWAEDNTGVSAQPEFALNPPEPG